jgi:uncharacterized membrane protein YeaQ/YmgE (transglycosylase-associated protein family)
MGILGWIIIGGLAGWIASLIMHEPQGCLMDVVVGVVGAFIGGAVFNLLTGAGFSGFNLWSLVVAVIGAVIFIVILRAIRGRPGAGA